jgi:hypothetical protein
MLSVAYRLQSGAPDAGLTNALDKSFLSWDKSALPFDGMHIKTATDSASVLINNLMFLSAFMCLPKNKKGFSGTGQCIFECTN